jgi:peptidyl-prolyl cis-trans isomerase SurA
MNNIKFSLLFAIGFMLLANSASAQFLVKSADRVVAMVGNEIILASDIESQFMLLESQNGGKLPPNARCLIFDQLLANSLLIAQAERDSIIVSDSEVDEQLDSRINQILGYMGNNEEQFVAYYGISPLGMKEKMRDDMRRQLIVQRMQQNIAQSLSITPREVQEFFGRIPSDSLPYFNSEVELAEIVIKPKVNAQEDEKARKMAETVRTQILEDTSAFCRLAAEYSNDKGSAVQCGRIGFTPRGQLVPEYEAAAYQLDINETSDVVKSEYGYHVIQLLQRLGNNIDTRHILIRPLIHLEDQELAQRRADSLRTLILLDSLTFDQAIQKYSEEPNSKNRNGDITNPANGETFIETGELDPDIFFAIDGLKTGEMTAPLPVISPTGETTYKIIKIRARTEPHIANLADDYARISAAAMEEKRAQHIDNWISRQISKHAVQINWTAIIGNTTIEQDMQNCPAMDKWRARTAEMKP